MRWIIAAVIVMLSAPAWGEEVLHCTETDNNGFTWKKGSSEGKPTSFKSRRFIVKIISDTKRTIHLFGSPKLPSAGVWIRNYKCRRPYGPSSSAILCNDRNGVSPWLFDNDTFVRAFLLGPPIVIAYGTCVKY